MPTDRMPALHLDEMTAVQKQAADTFQKSRGVPVFGPFVPMMRSPQLMERVQAVGEYLRYRSPVEPRLREFATLITAREWSQDYEWAVHYPLALDAGLSPDVADAIRDGRRPDVMAGDEALVYDLMSEISRSKRVSDMTYVRAVQTLGEQGIIDIVAIQGFYTWLAMTMNVTRVALPDYAKSLPRFPD